MAAVGMQESADAFEAVFPVFSPAATSLIARVPSPSSPSHLVLRRRELAVNSHEYSPETMRVLVKAQGEVYSEQVRENVPYYGGAHAVRNEISYSPPPPSCGSAILPRPMLPIPAVERPHILSTISISNAHRMCAGQTRSAVVRSGSPLDPGSPGSFDVPMIPQPMVFSLTCEPLDCARDYTLGLSSLFLAICCLVALRQLLFRSPLKPETPDVLIISLSFVQCFLGFVYYAFAESIGLELFIRTVKILQTLLICWLLLAGQRQLDPLVHNSVSLHRAFLGVAIAVVLIYLFAAFVMKPSKDVCRDSSWLIMSVLWLIVALSLVIVSFKMYRESKLRSLSRRESQSVLVGDVIGRRSMRAARPHGMSVDSDISPSPVLPGAGIVEAEGMERTRKNLLVLVGLEALAAFITVVWDIVLIIAARKDEGDEVVKSCEHFLAHAPWAETAAFILTRGFSLLVPQLAVLYVFYWVNRRLHASFRYNWDIDLSMGDTVCLPPAPTPFAAGSAGEPSFGFDEKTAQPYSGRQSDTHLPPVE
ncbi:hypothetical protein FOL47_009580 [Perkinsus chesapeaki]|uniref:Uncharacterized protein n=1 Tax=Perkinsus chesapeaki TaxID=330153 RepID=A0A7J6MRP1_PERCH|nr:hypothetical protein FOL47_009580 [Perkinsus chesapeaki]